MTIDTQPQAPQAPEVRADDAATPPLGRHAHTYALTWSGVRAVAQLDIRRRNRHRRGLVMLLLYLVVFTVLAALAKIGASSDGMTGDDRGATMFAVLVYLVLGVGFAVVPLLSATSINGDAHNGVLAGLQRTQLTPAEIAIGKLLAAWCAIFVLLLMAVPGLTWAYFQGGTSFARMLVTLGVATGSLMSACAVGLGWSATVSKISGAMTLTGLTLAVGVIGLPLLYALLLPLTAQTDRVTVSSAPELGSPDISCVTETQNIRRVHGEKIWFLAAFSPLVLVADASPLRKDVKDPLSYIRLRMREIGVGPRDNINNCEDIPDTEIQHRAYLREKLPPLWPMGIINDTIITLLFLQLTIERLRTTATRPPVRGSVV